MPERSGSVQRGTVLGKGTFWPGVRGWWLPYAPTGALAAPSQRAPTTRLQRSSHTCGACTRSISVKIFFFLRLLELFLAAGAFPPSGQLHKTPKEQRLNLARANQLCHSPRIAYFTDLKKHKTKKTPKSPATPSNHISEPTKLKKPFYTLGPCTVRMATSATQQPNLASSTADPQPLGGFSLGTQLVLEAMGCLPSPSSMLWHHHVVCNDGNGCTKESSVSVPE